MGTSERTGARSRTVQAGRMPRLSVRRWLRELAWRHLLLVPAAVFALFPLVWIVSSSVNAVDNLSTARIIPRHLTVDNFVELFTNPLTPFGTWIWNTWKVAVVAALGNVALAALAAFAFSRLHFRGRRVGLLSLVLVQVFPQFLGFIALFLLGQQIGDVADFVGLNTHGYLILVYLGGAVGFNAFLIKGYMDTVPGSLDESAAVEGASLWQVFARVILPLSRPVLAVIFIITFIGFYSEYILARTLLRSTDNMTLALGLQLFVSSDYSARWGNLSAAALIGAAPIVLTFLLAQRQIIGGLTRGAVKG